MANYSIVLNLRGSAVTNSKKLADNLERADEAAKSLKGNLQGMPNVPTGCRGGYYGGVGGGPTYGSSMGNGRVGVATTFSTQSGFGTVFHFAGKLNAALAVTDAIFRAAAQAVKIGAKFNIMAYTGGVQLLNKGAQILTSAQMGEGIRLLQRRQQARLGFGEGYAEAQERADLLAASYGLDPSNVIASMNVLTGMKVGGRKISTAQAERLTQVGGLIAQQSGMSFETVMINIQQMMSQAVPSMRDIRQLLTHAPILGRYALDEMEKKGITGMTAMEYLKADKGGLMSIFERYLSENPALLTMRARGMVQQANVGFYASLAESPEWLHLANRYTEVVKVAADAAKALLSAGVNSRALSTSVDSFLSLLKDAPALIDKFASKIDDWLITWGKFFGIDVASAREQGAMRTAQRESLRGYIAKNVGVFAKDYEKYGLQKNASREEVIEAAYQWAVSHGSLERFFTNVAFDPSAATRTLMYHNQPYPMGRIQSSDQLKQLTAFADAKMYGFTWKSTPITYARQQSNLIGAGFVPYNSPFVFNYLGFKTNSQYFWEVMRAKPNNDADLSKFGLDAASTGEAISGYGSDRKSLVINFNAPIVEWDSTINADDPQDVVNTVTETIEGAASRAIQIALLGATGTMSSRY